MIYDRSQSDIEQAREIRTNKVQKGEELTDKDIDTLERGCITINTLNRIEGKQEELYVKITQAGYSCEKISNKTWKFEDIFNQDDFDRVINNVEFLKKSFFVLFNTPAIPKPLFDFRNLNALEKILYDLDGNYNYMENKWKRCGIYRCGEG